MERALQTSADVAGVVVTMIVQREEDAQTLILMLGLYRKS